MGPQCQPDRAIKTLIRFERRPREGFFRSLAGLPRALLGLLLLWQQRASERTQLARLGDRDLQDVGLTRSEIMTEVEKPFWRP